LFEYGKMSVNPIVSGLISFKSAEDLSLMMSN